MDKIQNKVTDLVKNYTHIMSEMTDALVEILPINVFIKFDEVLYYMNDYLEDECELKYAYPQENISGLYGIMVTPHKELLGFVDSQVVSLDDMLRFYYRNDIQEYLSQHNIEDSADIREKFCENEIFPIKCIDIPFSVLYKIYRQYSFIQSKQIRLQ